MRRPFAIFLNLVIPPLGYAALRNDKRFILFALCFLLNRLLAPLVLLTVSIHPVIHFGWSAFGVIGLRLIVLIDTFVAREEDSSRLFSGAKAIGIICLYLICSVSAFAFQKYMSPRDAIVGEGFEGSHSQGDYVYIKRVWNTKSLKRGDVVIFEFNGATKISRVLGLPGEHVAILAKPRTAKGKEITTTEILINGKPLELEFRERPLTGYDLSFPERYATFEQKLEDRSFPVLERSEWQAPQTPEITLGSDQFFVIGDNRENSYDSRGFGPIAAGTISHVYAYTAASFDFRIGPCKDAIFNGKETPECLEADQGDQSWKHFVRRWERAQPRWNRWLKIVP